MRPDPQESADLVTFTEQFLMESFIICAISNTLNITGIYLLQKF